MVDQYQVYETQTDAKGDQTSIFINISDADYLPVSQGNTEKQNSIEFNSDVGFYFNTDTSSLLFWNGTEFLTVNLT